VSKPFELDALIDRVAAVTRRLASD
jgi:DNA-binding response OmpR family regulator